jgi:hypothetical protein
MNRLLTILLLAAGVAYGQIDNPPTTFPLPATFSTNVTVSGTATFATNVSVAGILSVGSLNTATPATWALDAVQTNSSGPSSFILTLPDTGNVIRVTNTSVIRNIANGRLGAFYYVINQSSGTIPIENTNGITVQGGRTLTLAQNEVATLVATGPTNVSVAGRGDLTDVALGGTLNTAPSQTNAASASSLMTRGLSDARYSFSQWYTGYELLALDNTTTTLKTLLSGNASGGIFDNQMVTIPDGNTKFNLPIDWRTTGQVKVVSYWSDRGATNVGGTNANIAIFCLPCSRIPTNNTTDSGSVTGTQVTTTFTANYGGAGRYYIVEQTLDFATVSGINATNPLQVKFVELQRRGTDAADTSTNTIWLSGVHIYVP